MTPAIKRWFYVELARWCKVFGQGDTALKFYRLALEARPHDPILLASIGFELNRQGRKREALAWFDRAVAAKPDYAEAHFDRGFLLQELNDPEAAIAAFDEALRHNPNHDRALYGKALSLIGLRRLDEAIAPLEKNTKLQPFSPYGWYQLARVQFDRGKPEKTQAIIEHLATFEPKVAAQLARETGLRMPER
jgi:tetratricopeptide (TPR) repeat protein